MIGSSIANPVTFLNLTGTQPNDWNTVHGSRKHGRHFIIPYCQRFDKDDVVTVQFYSDSTELPVMKTYQNSIEIAEIIGTLEITIDDRTYFNFEITFGSDYYDKTTTIIVTQSTDTLTSEPVYIEDLSEEIERGEVKCIRYSNFDRYYTDIENFFLEWSVLPDTLFFYVEAVDREIADKDEIENLTGSQAIYTTTAQLFAGINLKTAGIPKYMFRKLEAVSSLDYFAVNGLQYVKESTENSTFGGSTSFQAGVKLVENNTLGINIDDLGIMALTEKEWIKWETHHDKTGDFDVEIPDNYMLHTIMVKHSSGSTGNPATVTAGTTEGGTDYIEATNGTIDETGITYSFAIHDRPNLTAGGRLYIGLSGVGVKLEFYIDYLRNESF